MAAFATLNGLDVLTATIHEPRTGVWHADVEIDGEHEIEGSVTLDFAEGGATFAGTVFRSEPFAGRTPIRIVGGKGGLPNAVPAKFYAGASASTIVADILTIAGESLGSAQAVSDAGFLPRWSRTGGLAGNALAAILDKLGLSFRVSRAGLVDIAEDTFPELDTEGDILDRVPEEGRILFAPADAPEVRPGVTFDDTQIDYVVTRLRAGSLRQELWAEGSVPGRLKGALAAVLESFTGRKLAHRGLYPCTVVAQAADLSLDVTPDDVAELPLSGLTAVRIRHGLPGYTVKVPAGARVLVGFDGGDPSRPFALLWEAGSVTEVRFDGGSEDVARTNDTTSGGSMTAVAGATPVTFTYTPPGGPPQVGTTISLSGIITSGNPKLKA